MRRGKKNVQEWLAPHKNSQSDIQCFDIFFCVIYNFYISKRVIEWTNCSDTVGFFPSSAMAGNSGKKGHITHGIPMPQSSFDAEGLSSTAAVIPTHSRGNNVTATDLEALLHKALDRASGDDIRGGTASSGGEDMVGI